MGAFLSYCIVSGLVMLAMYLAYRLFLAGENQHGFNRVVLLLVYAVSFAALPVAGVLKHLPARGVPQASGLAGLATFDVAAPLRQPLWGSVLIWVFMAGMASVAVKTAVTWVRLSRVIRRGRRIERDGYTLVVADSERFAPFSWMRYVVVGRSDFENGCAAIAAHELKHVECRHWLDLLLAQAVCVVNWFNPAAWLMRDELMLVHEYQADMAVIDGGHDPQAYQMLLIKKAVGARFPSLANSLNHSKLKKRITMMYKEKSGAGRRFKALALVPMVALAFGLSGVPAVRAAMSVLSSSGVTAGKDSENPSADKATVKTFKVTNINNDGKQTVVTINGRGLGSSVTVSGGTFSTRGKTYEATSLSCNMTDGNAVIVATFPFSVVGEMKKPGMTLTVNGEEIPFNLENFLASAQSVEVGGRSKPNTTVVINGRESTVPGEMKIELDGKVIGEVEMKELDPSDIASVTVDRANNTIRISRKK